MKLPGLPPHPTPPNEALIELSAQVERFRYIIDSLPFLVASIDIEQRYIYANRTYESPQWFGCAREKLLGRTIREVVGEDEYELIRPYIERVLAGEVVEYDCESPSVETSVRYRRARYAPSRDPLTGRVVGYVSIIQDVSAQHDVEESTRWLAYHDSLTRLPNRALFHDRMEQAIARAARAKESVGLLYIDLDGFKPINDTYGHDRGDYLLQQVAARLQESIRGEDTAARLGGDEFVILLPFLNSKDEPVLVARRIHAALEPVFDFFPAPKTLLNPPSLSVCIGISIYPDHGADPEALLRHADQAMYRAKGEGPGSYCVYHHSGKL